MVTTPMSRVCLPRTWGSRSIWCRSPVQTVSHTWCPIRSTFWWHLWGLHPSELEQVDFSDPYAGIEIFVFGDASIPVSDAEDLSGHSIAVARASTQDTSITEIAPGDANIQRFDDDASAVQALLSGQTPLMGASNVVISQIESMAPGRFDTKFSLRRQSQAIAVRPGSDELLAYINDFLVRVKEDGSLNALHEEWVGGPLPDFVVSGE
jgi:polar amino acid transport system substrate-binding protein